MFQETIVNVRGFNDYEIIFINIVEVKAELRFNFFYFDIISLIIL